MKKPVIIGMGTITLIVPLAFGQAIYQNDFSTRESAEPIPAYGVVHEAHAYPYLATYSALCCNPNAAATSSRDVFYASSVGGSKNEYRPNYDGWFMPYFNVASKLTPIIMAYEYNNAVTFYSSKPNDWWCYVLHDIHNVFTNGVLRVQVDMKPPELWDKGNRTYVRVSPVYGKYMDILAWNGQYVWGQNGGSGVLAAGNAVTPGEFGIINAYSSTGSRTTTHLNCVGASGHVSYGSQFLQKYNTTNWVRFVATYNLDTSKFDITAYKFADDMLHPALETETPASALASKTSIDFPAAMSDELGGISGIAIHARGYMTGSGTITNKVLVDNFSLSWKAPGASDFEVFYENDFSNRWYKTICAANRGTSAAGYAPATTVTNVVDSSTITMGYLWMPSKNTFATNNIVPELSASPSDVQPIGFDGWRRLPYMDGNTAYCCNTASTGSQFDTGTGTNYLAFGNSKPFVPACALLANRIGETYTSGKVHLSVDARIPTIYDPGTTPSTLVSYIADTLRAAVGLGSTALYSSSRASLAANLIAGCGYLRTADGASTNHVPYVLAPASGSTVQYAYETSYTEPTVPYLYRMEIVADLDTRKYDVSVTPLAEKGIDGSFVPTESPIFTKNDVDFASSATDIGTFYLYGFGSRPIAGVNYSTTVRVTFDNIRIWRQATGAAEETLVYFNDFRTRTRTPSGEPLQINRATGYIANQYDRDDGPDHWMRRVTTGGVGALSAENYWATATVRDDSGNQFLALGRETEVGQRVQVSHTFGTAVTRSFKFMVDVRPPAAWRVEKDGEATISLGDAQFEQSALMDAPLNKHRQLAFGFCDAPGDSYCTWYRMGMQPVAYTVENGVETAVPLCAPSAIANDHWYRFKVTVLPEEGKYGIRLYDMGATHPTAGSGSGALVGSANNLSFLNNLAAGDGIAAFNIHANGIGGVLGEVGVDSDNVLIDNIRAEYLSGTIISFR